MKVNHIIIITLTCAAMALPLSAQGGKKVQTPAEVQAKAVVNDSAAVSGNNAASDEGAVPDVNDSIGKSDSDGVAKNDNLSTACFVVCLLTLIALILSIILIMKKMTVNDDNGTQKKLAQQIADMQTKLDQMQKLIQDMLREQSNILNEFGTKLGTVQKFATQQNVAINNGYVSQRDNMHQREQNDRQRNCDQQDVEKGTKSIDAHDFFATPSIEDGKIVLTPVNSTYADRAVFKVSVKVGVSNYSFNKSATKLVINFLDTMVAPFCDCAVNTNNVPSSIDTTRTGSVKKDGDKWIVVDKAQVSVT